MNILFVIGLPRSGTSLVQKLIHETTGRSAPSFNSFGIDVTKLPGIVFELNKTLVDNTSLAEDNDYKKYPDYKAYRKWLEVRSNHHDGKWVLKSPDHIAHLPELLDVFPEARFLWCLRPAGPTLASVKEYWQLTGVEPDYTMGTAVANAAHIAQAFPEKFDCIYTPTIPEFQSTRKTMWVTSESEAIDHLQQTVKGAVRNVSSRDFTKLYS